MAKPAVQFQGQVICQTSGVSSQYLLSDLGQSSKREQDGHQILIKSIRAEQTTVACENLSGREASCGESRSVREASWGKDGETFEDGEEERGEDQEHRVRVQRPPDGDQSTEGCQDGQ